MGPGKFYKGKTNGKGIPHGKGIMILSNGKIIEANWRNGKQGSKGYIIKKNGNNYVGSFMNNEPDGDGVEQVYKMG